MVEVAEEEHVAEGGEPMEEPSPKQPKGTEEAIGNPMPTETRKTYPEKPAKKSVLACKRSHPGNFIYLYSALHDYATTLITISYETVQLILIYDFSTFTASPEKIAIINSLPANVQDLLTDLGFDANITSENDIDAVLERVKKWVKVDINL